MSMPLRKLPEAFGLSAEKSWYPLLLNTTANMNYVGLSSDVSYYNVDQTHVSERNVFLSWYETFAKKEVFDNRHVFERYCQDDGAARGLSDVLSPLSADHEYGGVSREHDQLMSNFGLQQDYQKKFLQPDMIGIIPIGDYAGRMKWSKKAMAWLMQEENQEGKRILHGRNGKERQLS